MKVHIEDSRQKETFILPPIVVEDVIHSVCLLTKEAETETEVALVVYVVGPQTGLKFTWDIDGKIYITCKYVCLLRFVSGSDSNFYF